ncbi:MAG: biotin--[acetyl-CoA-carboxylase] ligase [Ignavibacteriota bacterium]
MWNITSFAELPSTQSLARERFASGDARHGDVFVALHQTGGRGRYRERVWHDEAGSNLLMSIVLTEIPLHLYDKIQLLSALSILATIRSLLSREIRDFSPERVQLKWPNDVLLDGKKVAGVLCDGIWSGENFRGVVIGIGMNINQEYFEKEITHRAIALKNVLKFSVPLDTARDLLLATIQFTLSHYTTAIQLISDIRTELEWMRSIPEFKISEPDGTKADGLRYDGITDEGALRVIASDGTLRIYQNATLTFT